MNNTPQPSAALRHYFLFVLTALALVTVYFLIRAAVTGNPWLYMTALYFLILTILINCLKQDIYTNQY